MNNKYIIGVIVVVLFIGAFLLLNRQSENQQDPPSNKSVSSSKLTLIDSITHGHGLAVDISNPGKLYIATHHGLLMLENEKDLYRIGESEDDFMGFTPHPTNSSIFFSSGHPATGGNIGFQKSEDGGITWQKLSNGVNGPVDFHAMTISSVNPNLVFGWYTGGLQRSIDGGKNWEVVQNTQFPIVSLAADTKDENILYAASPQGLFVSKNKGVSFEPVLEGFVSVVAVHPSDSQNLLSFSEKEGLAKSNDAGKTWERISEDFGTETPLFIAFNKQQPKIVYILTEKNSIYKSTDSGANWNKVR